MLNYYVYIDHVRVSVQDCEHEIRWHPESKISLSSIFTNFVRITCLSYLSTDWGSIVRGGLHVHVM